MLLSQRNKHIILTKRYECRSIIRLIWAASVFVVVVCFVLFVFVFAFHLFCFSFWFGFQFPVLVCFLNYTYSGMYRYSETDVDQKPSLLKFHCDWFSRQFLVLNSVFSKIDKIPYFLSALRNLCFDLLLFLSVSMSLSLFLSSSFFFLFSISQNTGSQLCFKICCCC